MILLVDSDGPHQTADTQAFLCLGCPLMPKDMFLHAAAHIIREK